MAVITIFLCWLFSSIAMVWNVHRFPNATFVLTASTPFFFFPAFWPLGFLAGIYLALLVLRLIIGDLNYKNYRKQSDYYGNQFYGINWRPLVRPFIVLVIVATIIPLFIMTNWYVLFTPGHIVIKPCFSITRTSWPYSDITNIYTAPVWIWQGKEIPNREYIIRLQNGEKWITTSTYNFPNTYSCPARLAPQQKTKILKFVSQKSEVPITETDFLNPKSDP